MRKRIKFTFIICISTLLTGCSSHDVLLIFNNTDFPITLKYRLNLEIVSNSYLNCNPEVFSPYNRKKLYELLKDEDAKTIPAKFSFRLKPKSAIVICQATNSDIASEDFALNSVEINSPSGTMSLSGDFLKNKFRNSKGFIYEYELRNP